nr:immunoglobulin light chain junction region [Macaca mulatta]MPN91432.1 immunoglobulin light chain junction region [Macaca mulatta]MPN96469.1 immunoglobulin light chain junction region [Macaca mulatta]MPN97332.1 immunoglobulin light chain junction region [Macaca mulatta]MPN98852.1 immunoglobulin light chain junction region [Macaca mulatta]
CMQVLQTPCTF